jgi:hypothetical protein
VLDFTAQDSRSLEVTIGWLLRSAELVVLVLLDESWRWLVAVRSVGGAPSWLVSWVVVVVFRASELVLDDDVLRSADMAPDADHRLLKAAQSASTNLPLKFRGEVVSVVLVDSVERVWRSSC